MRYMCPGALHSIHVRGEHYVFSADLKS